MSRTVSTTCPYCGVGCGVKATPTGAQSAVIAGDEQHPANAGRLCVKGSALGETLGLRGRLLEPLRRDAQGEFAEVSWDAALDEVAARFAGIVEQHGADAVALYVSGQLLTEDYYVANKLIKGYIGSANIDTNSRLCMSSAVAGHKRAFGEDVVPVNYSDLEQADLIVLVGSNTAWCHPILFQRMLAAKQARPQLQIVVIDPRRTATCESADMHLPIQPGTDVWLFNGLLAFLHQHGATDASFVGGHTSGAAACVEMASNSTGSLAHVARTCGLTEAGLREFYELFARTERVVTMFSMGVNQSSAGTDKVNSIINCHLLTGRIGKPGMGPFSITGQPNAMGGREVGGLCNQLAAHLDIDNAAHRDLVQRFWASPRIADRAGLKAVDLFDAIHDGKVKAVWIIGTNPIVSLPDADKAREALRRCEFVVVSDVLRETDTTVEADLLLPALAWGEKDGTVTNSERRVSRQRAFLPSPGAARPDWWALAEVGKRMGHAAAFSYEGAHEIFDEHARLSAFEQQRVPRVFNLAALCGLGAEAYEGLQPQQWPCLGDAPVRPYADGMFATSDGRARMLALRPRKPVHAADDDWPLVLNTGRLRDQWHTMTRTGRSARLSGHRPEPQVDVHPHDALLCGVKDGRLGVLTTRWGRCVVRVRTTTEQLRRQLFMPIHWNDRNASDARVGSLVNPVVDPVSGEPEFKHTPTRLEPFHVDWYGFVLARRPLPMDAARGAIWWTAIQGDQFLRYEIAGRGQIEDWSGWARMQLGVGEDADWIEASDAAEQQYRAAHLVDERIEACVFVSPRPDDLPAREWLSGLFLQPALEEIDRVGLMVGQPAQPGADPGPLVCSCFGVGRNVICAAIRDGLHSAEALGAKLRCGTNCGSCVPELKSLIALTRAELAEAG
ncbi:MAG TPA: molybdopterin-dependent oxidoreductase [Fontimonas sp.]